jgi:hypothetical protein
MNAIMTEIGWALESVYQHGLVSEAEHTEHNGSSTRQELQGISVERRPFAKVDGIAPGSPAAQAVGLTKV